MDSVGGTSGVGQSLTVSAVRRLRDFRNRMFGCLERRGDALFELIDALLAAASVPSLPHLSLQPTHRRGWGSVYAALATGDIDTERLAGVLAAQVPEGAGPVFAVDASTWARCDAECSPGRGFYYSPARHSAGQPIVAGWCYSWIAQLGFDRDSWTAPVDAQRVPPSEDIGQAAAGQIRAVSGRPTPAARRRCSSSAPATTRSRSPSISPIYRWRSWSASAATGSSTPLRRPGGRVRWAGRADTALGSAASTRPAGRPRSRPLMSTMSSTAGCR